MCHSIFYHNVSLVISCLVILLPFFFFFILMEYFILTYMSMWVSLQSFPFPINDFMFYMILHFPCHSVTPRNLSGFLSSLVSSYYLQTDLSNCLLLLACHLRILNTLVVPKLIPVVLQFILSSILIFHPLLLFPFPSF